jgi:hypothetical protein
MPPELSRPLNFGWLGLLQVVKLELGIILVVGYIVVEIMRILVPLLPEVNRHLRGKTVMFLPVTFLAYFLMLVDNGSMKIQVVLDYVFLKLLAISLQEPIKHLMDLAMINISYLFMVLVGNPLHPRQHLQVSVPVEVHQYHHL